MAILPMAQCDGISATELSVMADLNTVERHSNRGHSLSRLYGVFYTVQLAIFLQGCYNSIDIAGGFEALWLMLSMLHVQNSVQYESQLTPMATPVPSYHPFTVLKHIYLFMEMLKATLNTNFVANSVATWVSIYRPYYWVPTKLCALWYLWLGANQEPTTNCNK